MTQYQKIEKNIGDWELVLQSWGHFFKFLVSFIITMKGHFHCTKITFYLRKTNCLTHFSAYFVGLAYRGKDIVFRFIIEYSSLRDFGPEVYCYMRIFKDEIFWLVLELEIS